MSSKRLFLFVLFLCLATPSAPAATIRVPADQPSIQAGIDAAVNGDTVLVANGVYVGPGNRDLELTDQQITVMSEGGSESCIIDCQGSSGDAHRGFIARSNDAPGSVIDGFTLRNAYSTSYGGGIFCEASITIRNMVIEDCLTTTTGGGIFCRVSAPVIENVVFTGNVGTTGGCGGLFLGPGSRPEILRNCTFTGNSGNNTGGIEVDTENQVEIVGCSIVDNAGDGIRGWASISVTDCVISGNSSSGIYSFANSVSIHNTVITGNGNKGVYLSSRNDPSICTMTDSLIADNTSDGNGGGIFCGGQWAAEVRGCTITGNSSATRGGGIYLGGSGGATMNLTTSILWNNSAPQGAEAYLHNWYGGAVLSVYYTDVRGGGKFIELEPGCSVHPGEGVIDQDPLFAEGPGGGYYLGQTAAGQAEDSPCVDAGDPASGPVEGTTRTDLYPDLGVVDMGFHYSSIDGFIVAGLGPHAANPSTVRLFFPGPDSAPVFEFNAYAVPKFGVNVDCGNVLGTAADSILTGPGPGAVFGPHVRGFSSNGTPLPGLSFLAYGTNRYGVNLTAGDFDGDGYDEILTGAGPGAAFGPHVRAFDYDGGPAVTPVSGVSFMAYGTIRWGVNVAAGDLDGDGYDEIVTGAGPGPVFGAHVRGWNVDGGTAAAIPGISYFAYNTPRYGVVVGCGDVDGDGMDEIITAPGPSPAFGARVRGWNYDGTAMAELPGLDFFAWPSEEVRYGATVWAGTDLDLDGRDEIIVGGGPDPGTGSTVKVFDYQDQQVTLDFTIDAFPPVYTHGVNVAAGRF